MQQTFAQLRALRKTLVDLIESLTIDQLNQIPRGFANNIIWNVAHMVAAQQGICYLRANLPIVIDKQYFLPYKPGTHPEAPSDETIIDEIKILLLSTVDRLESDMQAGLFKDYTAWVNRFGIAISSTEDSAQFVLLHDAIHYGYVMALRKALQGASV